MKWIERAHGAGLLLHRVCTHFDTFYDFCDLENSAMIGITFFFLKCTECDFIGFNDLILIWKLQSEAKSSSPVTSSDSSEIMPVTTGLRSFLTFLCRNNMLYNSLFLSHRSRILTIAHRKWFESKQFDCYIIGFRDSDIQRPIEADRGMRPRHPKTTSLPFRDGPWNTVGCCAAPCSTQGSIMAWCGFSGAIGTGTDGFGDTACGWPASPSHDVFICEPSHQTHSLPISGLHRTGALLEKGGECGSWSRFQVMVYHP